MEPLLSRDKNLWDLFEAIVLLETKQECADFFRDLCTVSELKAMSERWLIAQMVEQKISYREISRKTGASTATITRIAHWVKYGEGGYPFMLDRLKEQAENAKREAGES